MKVFLKDAVLKILNFLFRDLNGRASVLMYHSVGRDGEYFAVSPEIFEKQMAYLKSKNFNLVSLRELIRKLKNNESLSNVVCVTFDDGYKNNYTNAFPVLKKYSIPFTIFVISDLIGKIIPTGGKSEEALSLAELRELANSGLAEIMPHSVSHRSFSRISLTEAKEECRISRLSVEEAIDKPAPLFCFPRGRVIPGIVDYLKSSGWDGAVTVEEGLISPKNDPFMLKRNAVDSSTSFEHFKAKVTASIVPFLWLKGLLK